MILNISVILLISICVCENKVTIGEFKEEKDFSFIRTIFNYNSGYRKGWTNFLVVGNFDDSFFKELQNIPQTFTIADGNYTRFKNDIVVRHPANTLVIDSNNFTDFEKKINIARKIPYWHPHSNTIINHHNCTESNEIIAKMFYALWYFKMPNAIILQYYNGHYSGRWRITRFSPYVSKKYQLEQSYGCWTRKKVTVTVKDFQNGIVCTKECHNITIDSHLRSEYFGTCIGFDKVSVRFNDSTTIQKMKLFEDKAKNLHGFTFRAFAIEIQPFFLINMNTDGTYALGGRDGLIWNTISERMNFSLYVPESLLKVRNTYDYELIVQYIVDLSRRKGEMLLLPVYQFDFIIVEIDNTIAFKESGVCVFSHRAGFETALFDVKLFQSNYTLFIEFFFCFIGIWFVFFIFNIVEKKDISYDQAGKDLVNAIRNILSVSLYKPPKKESFKMFLCITIWCFFILNFATQAAIISVFSAFKRGKDVDTFEDMVEKGYVVQGIASPDVVFPETEEKFRKINSKRVHIRDLFGCINLMINDSHRFCLMDCSVGRYLVRNKLDEKGEQFLHIGKDQVHNHYLNMILQKHSPLTTEFNRIMRQLIQAGLINKWEQYRYADIKPEAPVKSLDMKDLLGIFICYIMLVVLSTFIFVIEITMGARKDIKMTETI